MNADEKKQLLEAYGRLYNAVNMPAGFHPDIENKKKALEAIQKEMKRYNLSHKDYVEYKEMKRYLATANSLIESEANKEKSIQGDTIKIVIGAILFLLGISFTGMSNGKVLFYGLIIGGIGLVISGIIGINVMKNND